jgi:hypothetical protein
MPNSTDLRKTALGLLDKTGLVEDMAVQQGLGSHAKGPCGRADPPAGPLHVRRDPRAWLARTTLVGRLLVAAGMVVVKFPWCATTFQGSKACN